MNQEFEFNDHYCHNKELISTVVKSKYKIIKRLQGFSCTHFLIVYNEKKAVIGLPFYEKKDRLYVLGIKEYFDYSDAFFSNEDYKTIKEAFMEMIEFLSKKYNKIMWNYLPQDSIIKLILDEYKVMPIKCVKNVSIDYTGLNYDEYFKSLSKSNKQNLRTAVNRITRENGTIQLITNFDHNLDCYVFKDATSLYIKRQKNKYEKNHFFLRKINFKYFNFMINLMKKNKGVFFGLYINGELSAFMFGLVNKKALSFEVNKLAIDDKYKFYSPGMILISKTIEYLVNNTNISKLDLCRGTEEYKFKMGGIIYNTFNYEIDLNDFSSCKDK